MLIKNIIITVLTLLLIIVVCFYSYLASQMQDYEKERLEYIINKENELNQKENQIAAGQTCKVKLSECEISKKHINSILDELTRKKNNILTESVEQENQEQEQQQEQYQYQDVVEPNI